MNNNALHNRLARLPMLKAFVPFAAGIVLAEYHSLPALFVWAGFFVCGALALTARSSLYTLTALLFFGWGMPGLRTLPPDPVPRGIRTEFSLSVGDQSDATLTAWRDGQGSWHATALPVLLRTDSVLTLHAGERLRVRAYLNDFPEGSYGTLMRRRGYAGNIWLAGYSVLSREPAGGTTLHAAAVERLRRMGLPGKEHALCAAMAAGGRSDLTPELRKAYARSGTSHLLSVSGLHVGIVFALINLLLWWLPLLQRGHLIRNLVAVALIWLYAATTGLSPSVVRAALMFSALQFSLASASVYVSGNILAGTALAMLLLRPSYLFDISFQLSFVAVAAILAWGVPLCRLLHTRYRTLNLLYDSVWIGVVASVATAPLVAHTFGIVSLIGIAVNPLVIPLALIAVLGSLIWIIMPVTALAPLFRLVTGTAARWQNTLAEQSAALPGAAFEWSPSTGVTAAIYCGMVAITLAAWSREAKKPLPLGP